MTFTLRPIEVGLLELYEVLQGPHAACLAYRKGLWKMISNGSIDVGEDVPPCVVSCVSCVVGSENTLGLESHRY